MSRTTIRYAKICSICITKFVYLQAIGKKLPWALKSPENIKDKKYSPRSDCWSFGVLLWEIMSSGSQPFCSQGIEQAQCWEIIESGKICETLQQPKDCPDKVYALMKECWNMDRKKRINMTQIKDKLTQLQANETSKLSLADTATKNSPPTSTH